MQTLAQNPTRVSKPTSFYESIEIMDTEDGVVQPSMLASCQNELTFMNPLMLMLAWLKIVLVGLEIVLAGLEIVLARLESKLALGLSPFRMFLGYTLHYGAPFFSLHQVWFNAYRLPSGTEKVATSRRSLWKWTLHRMRTSWTLLVTMDTLILP